MPTDENDHAREMTTNAPRPPGASALAIDWRVVLRGALVGLAVIVPVTVLRVVLDREISDFDNGGWVYPLFVLILIGYAASGWVAGPRPPGLTAHARRTHGDRGPRAVDPHPHRDLGRPPRRVAGS